LKAYSECNEMQLTSVSPKTITIQKRYVYEWKLNGGNKMKRKVGLLFACLIVFIGVLAGCSSEKSSSDGGKVEKKDLRFVIVPKVVHPWFDEVNKGAKAEAKVLEQQLGVNVKIDYIAPTTADVTEQNKILEQAASTHPDGIAVDPLDAKGNKQVLDEIRKQGIKVIVFDSPSPEGSGISSVGNDFYEQGVIAAERLAKILDYKGKVAIMQGFPTAPNHQERYKAQVDTLKKYPGITIVDGGIDNDDIQTAQQQAAAVLASNPDLKGYLMCDASGPIGIPAAIKEAGKEGKVIAVGMDSLKPILQAVKDGALEGSSATIPRMQGSMAVLMLWQASIGVDIPKTIDTGIDVITKDNVGDFLSKQN
jgi:ribose transport system substrate-binding protein